MFFLFFKYIYTKTQMYFSVKKIYIFKFLLHTHEMYFLKKIYLQLNQFYNTIFN